MGASSFIPSKTQFVKVAVAIIALAMLLRMARPYIPTGVSNWLPNL